ncbi:MAG: hypothetical protein IJZ30_00860 [Alphaproteobacteria bacterium]|nr:hypothetical protein [Alphaproteobacteria bacterium]
MVKGISNAVIGDVNAEGCEKKFVTNTTTNTYDKGEKVLVNLGIRPSELSRGYDLTSTSPEKDRGSVFVDDNNVIVYFINNGRYKYTFENHQWNALDINSWISYSYPENSGICTYKDGTVRLGCASYQGAISSSTTGILMTSSSLRALPSGYSYMGSYNGKSYAYYSEGNVINVYDKLANVVSDSVLDLANQTSNAYLGNDGYGFVYDTVGNVYFIKVNDDGSVVNEKTIATGFRVGRYDSNPVVLYTQTGANIGDFLFFVTNYGYCYNYLGSSTQKQISNLITYEIVDDGNGGRTIKERPDLFNKFQTDNCLIQYDNRNDVLTIGTMDNVYAYKFNRDDRNFEQLNYTFMLPDNINQNYCYRLAFSPDMSKAIVTLRSDYQNMNVSLFTLGNANWEIVDNQVINYNATTSFSAITTGEVDEDGKVEVKLTLPDKVDLVIDTNVEINEGDIVVEGVE